jgi:phosphoribosyl-AMP cyclohydrolase
MSLDPAIAARLKRNDAGLVSAVAQERATGDVLMVAWMDDEALARTLETRKATYYSRSRQQYWVKGETSGHTQYVHEVRLDCATPARTPASTRMCSWPRDPEQAPG